MLISTKKAAEYLGITPHTLLNWVKQGKIPCIKINQRVYKFDRENIDWILHELFCKVEDGDGGDAAAEESQNTDNVRVSEENTSEEI